MRARPGAWERECVLLLCVTISVGEICPLRFTFPSDGFIFELNESIAVVVQLIPSMNVLTRDVGFTLHAWKEDTEGASFSTCMYNMYTHLRSGTRLCSRRYSVWAYICTCVTMHL